MATGSGKTVVMAMLIAWQALNKLADPYDKRFSTRFLIVTPGITIRDRLRVLLPNDPGNYYRVMDVVTPEQLDRLQAATIEITNYHAFIRREKVQAAGLTKRILAGRASTERFKETPGEMVRRVCRVFGNAKDIVVLNDEAHHCYAPAPVEDGEGALDADERTEATPHDRGGPGLVRRPPGRHATRSASEPSSTSPPRPSSCGARATPRARSSPGSCRTSGSWTPSSRASSRSRACPVADDSMIGDLPDLSRPVGPRP